MKKTVCWLIASVLVATFSAALHAQTSIEPAKPAKSTTQAGKLNAITDVPGVEVGNSDQRFSGTTVVMAPKGAFGLWLHACEYQCARSRRGRHPGGRILCAMLHAQAVGTTLSYKDKSPGAFAR